MVEPLWELSFQERSPLFVQIREIDALPKPHAGARKRLA